MKKGGNEIANAYLERALNKFYQKKFKEQHDCMNYILEGKTPVKEPDLMKWGKFMQSGNRILKQTVIDEETDKIMVSTVFLGVDHGMYGQSLQPIVFETMVFNGKHDNYCKRYSGYDEALNDHDNICLIAFE